MTGSAVNPTRDIIDTILVDTSFKTLLSALQAVRMVDSLKGAGPFTLFAPTDDAFEKLSAGTVQQWEKPENAVGLKRLLDGHIASGAHDAGDLRQRMSIQAITGEQYSIVSSGTGITVGGSHIQGHPIRCTNGIIHVIDNVLQPV